MNDTKTCSECLGDYGCEDFDPDSEICRACIAMLEREFEEDLLYEEQAIDGADYYE